MGESLGKTGAPTTFYENLNLLTWFPADLHPLRARLLHGHQPSSSGSHTPHPTPPAPAAGRISTRYHGWYARTGRVAPESPPLRARSLHGRQLSLSCFHLTSHTPCTRCRSNFTQVLVVPRVVRENEPGRPRITPPPALTLASRPPTLSQLLSNLTFHLTPHPLHPLQVNFYRYDGWCARTGRVASDSPPCALARFTPSIEFGTVGNRQTS
jgi:hypothetical protein